MPGQALIQVVRRADEIAHAPRPGVGSGIRPTRAEIDLDAIAQNATRLKQLVGADVGILGVVKADAYGHGAVPVARALAARDEIAGLAVSLAEEGIELRRAGVGGEILVMGGVYLGAHRDLVALDLVPIVSDAVDVIAFGRAARAANTTARIHVKVDTGMSRLGVRPEKLRELLEVVAGEPGVKLVGFCTHLASADMPDPTQTEEQLRRFAEAIPMARAVAGGELVIHAANSAGAIRFPAARHDAVRPGLALYGGQSLEAGFTPAMRLITSIAQLRDLQPGDAVSYGAHWRAQRPARVATLPCGYADGYPRRLSNTGEVLIRGVRCPVVGAVCMDMTIVDVTGVEGAAIGDEAVLLGAQGDERITAQELAEKAGLIEYEITCGVSKRVPRVYVGG